MNWMNENLQTSVQVCCFWVRIKVLHFYLVHWNLGNSNAGYDPKNFTLRFLQCYYLSVLFTGILWQKHSKVKGFPYLLACLEKNWGGWGKSGDSGDLLSFITALGHMSTEEPEKFRSHALKWTLSPLLDERWGKRDFELQQCLSFSCCF